MAKSKQGSVPDSISASLFKLATDLENQGLIKQAVPAYLKLISRYPNSPVTPDAIERVLAVVESMRKMGQHHVAMTVLDQLEAAYQGS